MKLKFIVAHNMFPGTILLYDFPLHLASSNLKPTDRQTNTHARAHARAHIHTYTYKFYKKIEIIHIAIN